MYCLRTVRYLCPARPSSIPHVPYYLVLVRIICTRTPRRFAGVDGGTVACATHDAHVKAHRFSGLVREVRFIATIKLFMVYDSQLKG